MRHLLIAMPLLALPYATQAATQVAVNVSGTLIAPTVCNVTAKSAVNFGNIISSKINGTLYQQDLGVNLSCTGRNSAEVVYITLTGTGASGNRLPVSGTAKGFDLALKRNASTQNFGTRLRVDTDGALNLNITPTKTSASFVHGTFTAAITVTVEVV